MHPFYHRNSPHVHPYVTVLFLALGCCFIMGLRGEAYKSLVHPQLFAKSSKYTQGGSLKRVFFEVPSDQEDSTHTPITREGLLLTRPNAQGTLFICHGFMCNKFDCSFLRMMFPDFNVFIFDFRAHGERLDQAHYCTFGRDEAQDVKAAVYYCKNVEGLTGLRMVYGFSMGAVASIIAQASDPTLFDAMVLDCPYDDSLNVIKKGLENWRLPFLGYQLPGKEMLEQYAFNPWLQSCIKGLLKTIANMDTKGINTHIYPVHPAQAAKAIIVPCLLIHCANDEKVPVSAAHAIFNNIQGPKKLVITAGRYHFDSLFFYPERYFHLINSFLHKVVKGTIYNNTQAKIVEDPA